MKILVIAVLSVVVGVSAGFALTRSEFSGVEERFSVRSQSPTRQETPDSLDPEPAHVVVVGGDEFNFGILRRFEQRERTFVITNEGDDLLRLQYRSASCGKCIGTKFTQGTVQKDEQYEIDVVYKTNKGDEDFHEYIEIITNDLEKPVIRLNVLGKVTERIRLSSEEVELGNLSASDTAAETFRIFGYHSDELEISPPKFSTPETADKFKVQITPLDVSELAMDPRPLAAAEIEVRVEAGLPVGPIQQNLQFRVQAGEESALHIPLLGTVTSDIALIGFSNFKRSSNTLTLGRVPQAEGASAKLRIRVRGPQRDNIQLKVESVDPADVLQATLGERMVSGNGSVNMYPLEISVLAGSPKINRLGSYQAEVAKVTIGTTHPDAKQMIIYVRFAVD